MCWSRAGSTASALAFGLEYDFPKGVTGDYFHFALSVSGGCSGVRAACAWCNLRRRRESCWRRRSRLAAEEREKNFEMLRFISAETAARGLHFQLGHLDSCLRMDGQPKSTTDRRADAGDSCGVLPRCAGDRLEGVSGDSGADAAGAWRERNSGGKLRFLEDAV